LSEWTNIKDKLPEQDEDVLVYDGEIMVVSHLIEDIMVDSISRRFLHNKYFDEKTYWMPLPEPPNGV
jgi:6-phosphogluconate dehydrogenase (decarboxylating)